MYGTIPPFSIRPCIMTITQSNNYFLGHYGLTSTKSYRFTTAYVHTRFRQDPSTGSSVERGEQRGIDSTCSSKHSCFV
jgi:hypothetical protein